MHLRMHHEFHVPAWLAKLVHAALLALVALLVLALPRALAF